MSWLDDLEYIEIECYRRHRWYTELVESRPVLPCPEREIRGLFKIYREIGFENIPDDPEIPSKQSVPERSPYDDHRFLQRELLVNDSLRLLWESRYTDMSYPEFLRSLGCCAVVTVHRRGVLDQVCADLNLYRHEQPRRSELNRFVGVFTDHQEAWEDDPAEYLRVFRALVPTGLLLATVLSESYAALVNAVSNQEYQGGLLRHQVRARVARALYTLGVPVSRRGLANGFGISERELGHNGRHRRAE